MMPHRNCATQCDFGEEDYELLLVSDFFIKKIKKSRKKILFLIFLSRSKVKGLAL
jgi:hypothetical protein